jgi:hypothetical protein
LLANWLPIALRGCHGSDQHCSTSYGHVAHPILPRLTSTDMVGVETAWR